MMKMIRQILIWCSYSSIVLFLSASSSSTVTAEPCCMCSGSGQCNPFNERSNTMIDSTSGMTCMDYYVSLASQYTTGSTECTQMSDIHYDRCCTNGPFVLDSDPQQQQHDCSNIPASNVGASCDVCANGRYPLRPSTISTISGIDGSPSCASLYCMAKKGYIPSDICRPLQTFLDIPCGCYQDFDIHPDIHVSNPQQPPSIHQTSTGGGSSSSAGVVGTKPVRKPRMMMMMYKKRIMNMKRQFRMRNRNNNNNNNNNNNSVNANKNNRMRMRMRMSMNGTTMTNNNMQSHSFGANSATINIPCP
jgi:hypothetical protein